MEYDVFISYATEDKEQLVAPLKAKLTALGVKVWFAPAILKVGDSLSRSIDKGLATSKFGVIVLSKVFINKPWTEYELRGLTSKAIGKGKVIIPIWHGISRDEVLSFSPPLADIFALDSSRISIIEIALQITEIVRPDIFKNLLRLRVWQKLKNEATASVASPKNIELGPIRHETLPDNFLVRTKIIQRTFGDILPISLDETIDSFRRDVHPMEEIEHWEKLAGAYLDLIQGKNISLEKKKDIFGALLAFSNGTMDKNRANTFEHLIYDEVVEIGRAFLSVIPKILELEEE